MESGALRAGSRFGFSAYSRPFYPCALRFSREICAPGTESTLCLMNLRSCCARFHLSQIRVPMNVRPYSGHRVPKPCIKAAGTPVCAAGHTGGAPAWANCEKDLTNREKMSILNGQAILPTEYGPFAQLGERKVRNLEVRGSNTRIFTAQRWPFRRKGRRSRKSEVSRSAAEYPPMVFCVSKRHPGFLQFNMGH